MVTMLRPRQAAQALGIALSTFWLKAKTDPDFPKLIRLSATMTVVRESDLEEYLAKKASAPCVPRPPRPRKAMKDLTNSAA